jgi:hypothetical protein
LLGRISAQTAKQVIFQKIREVEWETIYQEYSGRVGERVNCTVKRIEGTDAVLDLGKAEARLPKIEQSRLENYSVSDRLRCVIKAVDKSSKGRGWSFRGRRRSWSCGGSSRRFPNLRRNHRDQRLRPGSRGADQDRGAEL